MNLASARSCETVERAASSASLTVRGTVGMSRVQRIFGVTAAEDCVSNTSSAVAQRCHSSASARRRGAPRTRTGDIWSRVMDHKNKAGRLRRGLVLRRSAVRPVRPGLRWCLQLHSLRQRYLRVNLSIAAPLPGQRGSAPCSRQPDAIERLQQPAPGAVELYLRRSRPMWRLCS